MNFIPLDDAGNIQGIAYDSTSKDLLIVSFAGRFLYKGVPEQVVEGFLRTSLKEQFYLNQIRGKYPAAPLGVSRRKARIK